ncbi:PAS domain S-box protein [Rhodocytophaga aerolata]|uniref:histidine kinase n=1 Tax=Rhodocytophaga aerolata TaxID=455078 RepID=A0ABT8RA75_9BACT|nr:PAS domain S-box protein [Rhodocytophaga aerolata]MDO1448996.1 PAS domain S-box protein [Rhodocytophaga aerolata]
MIKKVQAVDARTAISLNSTDTAVAAAALSAGLPTNRMVSILQTINQCRQQLIRAVEEKQLLEAICRILTENECYQMAWVGSAVLEENKKARRIHHMQFQAGHPATVKDIWRHSPLKQTEKALRTQHPQIVQDLFSPGFSQQWQEKASSHKLSSLISIPLLYTNQILGVLTLYGKGAHTFEAEEVALLIELTEDLAYSVYQVRQRIAQQQTLQQLNISEKYFHALIEHASDIILVVNHLGITAFASPSVQRVLGYSAATTIGTPFLELVHPEDQEAINSLLNATPIPKEIQKTAARCKHTNGQWVHFDCTISDQLHGPDIQGYVVNLHEITSLKEAESKLRRQQQEQQIIFDSVPALITFKDTYNRILRANRTAASFYGLSKGEIEGRTLYELNPLFAAKYHKEDIEIITSGIAKLNIIEKILLPSGQTKWLQTNKIPYYDERGDTTGIIIFAQEITAQRTTEEELRTTLEELKWRNHELDNYFYKVSHDLRAPLCTIEGLISLMKTENNQQMNTHYLELIEKSVYKLDNFIKTILNHSNALHTPAQIAKINFSHIVYTCLDELGYVPGHAKVKTTLTVNAGHVFYQDATRIAIVFKQLISNSLKFFNPYAEESYLHIQIAVTQTKALITLEDNGMGIEKKYLPKVFNMFFKATDKSEGAGLGLYVVKQTIEKLGGSISVKSECGKGTTFKLVLANLQV